LIYRKYYSAGGWGVLILNTFLILPIDFENKIANVMLVKILTPANVSSF